MLKRAIVIACSLLWLCVPSLAFAYNPLSTACQTQGGAGNASVACGTTGKDTLDGSGGTLGKAAVLIALISGIAAVIIIVVAGFMYVVSGGDAQKVAVARNAMTDALVGLGIIAAAASIIAFVVNKV